MFTSMWTRRASARSRKESEKTPSRRSPVVRYCGSWRLDGQDLVEEVEHRPPGAPVAGRVIVEPRPAKGVCAGVGEGVAGAAVEDHPPVDARGGHLLLEGQALLGRDDGIVGADLDQDLAFHRPGCCRPRCT